MKLRWFVDVTDMTDERAQVEEWKRRYRCMIEASSHQTTHQIDTGVGTYSRQRVSMSGRMRPDTI
jgi:hypothetical protein